MLMAARDRLIARCQEFLPSGAQIRHVFRCSNLDGGGHWLDLFYDVFVASSFVVAVTADEIFVLRAWNWLPSTVRGLEARLPRTHPFNLSEGSFGFEVTLMYGPYQVDSRDRDEVRAMEAEMKPEPRVEDKAIPSP